MGISQRVWGALTRHPGQLIWVALAYLPFLGSMSVPLTGDQKLYLAIAQEMREAGQWLTPLLYGETRYFKPPLEYWGTLAGWKLFGFNLWGAFLPSVLCVGLTAWLLGEIAQLLQEKRRFVNAGIWFAAALGTATYGTVAQMEIYLCLFFAAAWWAGLKFLDRPIDQRDWRWLFLAFVITGVSAWVKSPLYSVFWVVSFVTYLLIAGEWEMFRERKLYAAWVLGAFVGAGWYLAVMVLDFDRFWTEYALRESWEKKQGNGGSVASLWWALLYFSFPMTLVLFPSLRAVWRGYRSGSLLRFAFAWTWPMALFFSVYPYRIKPYLYPLVPVVALLVDWGFYQSGRTRIFRTAFLSTGALYAWIFAVIGFVLFRAEMIPGWLALAMLALGLWALACAWKDWVRGFALAALGGVLLFRIAAISIGEADLAGLRMAITLEPEVPTWAMLDESRNVWHEYALVGSALGRPLQRLSSWTEVEDVLRSGGRVILSDEQLSQGLERLRLSVGTGGQLSETPWWRWKGRLKFPFRELILQGRAGIPNWDELLKRRFVILSLGRNG